MIHFFFHFSFIIWKFFFPFQSLIFDFAKVNTFWIFVMYTFLIYLYFSTIESLMLMSWLLTKFNNTFHAHSLRKALALYFPGTTYENILKESISATLNRVVIIYFLYFYFRNTSFLHLPRFLISEINKF